MSDTPRSIHHNASPSQSDALSEALSVARRAWGDTPAPATILDAAMYELIDAWCARQEDTMLIASVMVQLALLKRQVERGTFSQDEYAEMVREIVEAAND